MNKLISLAIMWASLTFLYPMAIATVPFFGTKYGLTLFVFISFVGVHFLNIITNKQRASLSSILDKDLYNTLLVQFGISLINDIAVTTGILGIIKIASQNEYTRGIIYLLPVFLSQLLRTMLKSY